MSSDDDLAALRTSLAHLRAREHISPVGVFHTDPSGDCLYVNERWAALSGISAEEALGSGWARSLHPDDRERVVGIWLEATRKGVAPAPTEVRYLHADGQVRWGICQAEAIRDAAGAVTGYVGTATDVTELKQVQEALRAEKELSERVITSSRDGILAFDRELRYTVWNRAMEEIAGMPAEAVLGRCAFEVFPFLEEIGEDRFFHSALAGEHRVARDRRFEIPSSGRSGFFEGHYGPLRDGSGAVVGGLAVIRNITERKNAADALRVAQLQAVHSGKLASMGRLGAGIAHELNQPLSALKIILALMREHPERLVAASLGELDLALEQVDRMARIVDNVRGFARQSDFAAAPTPARAALDDALALLQEQVRGAGVAIDLDLPHDLPLILADRLRLQQVFLNLLINALQALEDSAASPGEQRIEVRARATGAEVVFRVRDTGAGVSAEASQHLFDPFFTTKEQGRGTGLGLSLAFGIADEHGGGLSYEAPVGAGACFVLRLPQAHPGAAHQPAVPAPRESASRSLSARVLVLDDEVVLRRALGRCLTELDCTHTASATPEELYAELARADYDLALVDLRLEGCDGVEVCARLRREHPALSVVAMSGFVTEAAHERLEQLGVQVLAKPFGIDALGSVVEAAAARAPSAQRPKA